MAGLLHLDNNGTTPPAAAPGTVSLFTRTSDRQLYTIDETGAVAGPFGFTYANAADVLAGTSNNSATTPAALRGAGVNPLVSSTAQTLSGTQVDFLGIPSWVRRVTVMFSNLSGNGASNPIVQLGTASAFETTGYEGASAFCGSSTGATLNTSGFTLAASAAAATQYSGILVLECLDSTNHVWVASLTGAYTTGAFTLIGAGSKAIASQLTRIRLTFLNGTTTFDNGFANIMYE